MPRRAFIILAIFLLSVLLSTSHTQQPNLERGQSLLLASYTDTNNEIAVSVRLTRNVDGSFSLEGTFIPPSGYHLYSKDLPRRDIDGQGRPTLLELPSSSRMHSTGALTESVDSEMFGYEPDGQLVYPEGPLTLTLPIQLPQASGWVKDQVSLTYTACTMTICKEPTIGKLIPVRVPGALSFSP
jgi:hypothetical protein